MSARKYYRNDGGFNLSARINGTERIEKFDMHGNLMQIEMHSPGVSRIATHTREDIYDTLGQTPVLIKSTLEKTGIYQMLDDIFTRHSPPPDNDD